MACHCDGFLCRLWRCSLWVSGYSREGHCCYRDLIAATDTTQVPFLASWPCATGRTFSAPDIGTRKGSSMSRPPKNLPLFRSYLLEPFLAHWDRPSSLTILAAAPRSSSRLGYSILALFCRPLQLLFLCFLLVASLLGSELA